MNTDKRLLLLAPQDNCLIVCAPLTKGDVLLIEGHVHTLPFDIPVGHKLARLAMTKGSKILRYGAPIGSLMSDVQRGEHLHTHNLQSDYLPTYTLADGKRFVH